MSKQTMTKIAAIRQYFGMKPNQTLKDFMEEIKALTTEEKDWFASECARELGVEIAESTGRTA